MKSKRFATPFRLGLLGALALLVVIVPAYAVTYTIVVRTDLPSYAGAQTIHISGVVTPPYGPNTAAFIQVENPSHNTVLVGEAEVNATSGEFLMSSVAGGSANWVSGTYTVTATWGGNGVPINASASFVYSPTTTSSTTSTSSTSSTSTITTSSTTTTNTTTTSSTSSSTSSSSTSSSSAVPEFGTQALVVTALAAVAAVALLANRAIRPKRL